MTAALFPDLIVNGEHVPHAEVAAETQNHPAPKGKPGIAWRKAANALAVRTLLVQEARKRGLEADPAEVAPGRFETDEEALIRGVLESEVDVETPSEADIRAEWERDPTRFRTPPLWDVSHILVACDPRDEDQTAAARARAEDVAKQAKENPRGFGRLAAEHSDCSSKSSGGTLGQLGPGDTVPEFEAALRDMESGEIGAPVLSRHGWHVIHMEAAAEGEVLPYEAVRKKIAVAMEKAAWARAARDFVDSLVAAADIKGAEVGREQAGERGHDGSAS